MDFVAWIPTVICAVLAIAVFAGRNWIKAGIEKSVQHKFDEKIGSIRTELRKNEELFKSDLRAKEAEISALRDGALSGRAQRQALLDKRRIEAVERIWLAVFALGPYKVVSASMAIFKFDEVGKRAPHDPKVRQLFEMIGRPVSGETKNLHNMAVEQLFISPLSWAYFSAYRTVVVYGYMQVKILEIGIEEPCKYLNSDNVRRLLKATLPHQKEFIDKNEPTTYYYLLDEIEQALLSELNNMLEGRDIDQTTIDQSREIMEAVKKISTENEQQTVRAASQNP
jgi:hypothetical protein